MRSAIRLERMVMTKEECLQALNSACEKTVEIDDYNSIPQATYCCIESEMNVFKQLIIEHFDNPPLSFDDLKPCMWVWDDLKKRYDCIIALDVATAPTPIIEMTESYEHFEQNRFYRRQKE